MDQARTEGQWLPSYPQPPYIPARETATAPFSWKKSSIPIASKTNPDHICGIAMRVGSIREREQEQVLYRLKFRRNIVNMKLATLPNFFILEDGVFVEYERSGNTLN